MASQQSSTRKRSRSERQCEALELGVVFVVSVCALTAFWAQDLQSNTPPFGGDLWNEFRQGTQSIVVVCI